LEQSTAYVALGSNLGDRDVHLAFALRALADIEGVEVVECSPVYETDPVGPGEQRRYLNAVVRLRSALTARALLDALMDVEARAGRHRHLETTRWGPRTLDLDLLFLGDCEIVEPDLVVPHPRLAERAFVLVPLADIAPDLVHPSSGDSIAELLARVRRDGIRPWERCLRIPASAGSPVGGS